MVCCGSPSGDGVSPSLGGGTGDGVAANVFGYGDVGIADMSNGSSEKKKEIVQLNCISTFFKLQLLTLG